MQVQAIDGIFYVCVLIMSVVIHEFAHGYVAYLYGDQTARLQGRLTLNPLRHLDPFGSVILPLLLIISNAGFVIGWARPVPYNPNNLRKGRASKIAVAVAGIAANMAIAILFGLFMRFGPVFGLSYMGNLAIYHILSVIVFTNLVLGFFNMIPIPPLDGSKILFTLLPSRLSFIENFLERWGMMVLLLFIVFLWAHVSPVIVYLFSLITGLS